MAELDRSTRAGERSRRRWLGLFFRMGRLFLGERGIAGDLVRASYDRHAAGYDEAWTDHMRDLSLEMVEALGPIEGRRSIDLACGTGFVTRELSKRSGLRAIGVDRSSGMLAVARARHGGDCDFVEADAVGFLRGSPSGSAGAVTCAWGLGYTRPWHVIREAARVLEPGGRLGIIDNSLFSLAGVLWCSVLTFAEEPEALVHLMRARFLPGSLALAASMRLSGLSVARRWHGSRSFRTTGGAAAIDRLTATGAAAGFEFACDPARQERVFRRFAEVLEERCESGGEIRIVHRYIAAIGVKR